jgi:hypothetical protein
VIVFAALERAFDLLQIWRRAVDLIRSTTGAVETDKHG